jgi:hypothetical protein
MRAAVVTGERDFAVASAAEGLLPSMSNRKMLASLNG